MGMPEWSLVVPLGVLLCSVDASAQVQVEPSRSVFGRVLDRAGEPLADVEIRPLRLLDMQLGEALATSAADGSYEVPLTASQIGRWDPAHSSWLHFRLPRYVSMAAVPAATIPRHRRPIDVVMLRAGSVVGRVVDPSGAGLQGATVLAGEAATFPYTVPFQRDDGRLPGDQSLVLAITTSGPDGAFLLTDALPLGTRLRAWKPGWSTTCSDVVAPTESTRLRLEPTGAVRGQVQPVGEGLDPRWVGLIDAGGRMALAPIDADGNFTLWRPSSDRFSVDGFDPRQTHSLSFWGEPLDCFDTPVQDWKLELRRIPPPTWDERPPGAGSVRGQVLGSSSGTPLAGALIQAEPVPQSRHLPWVREFWWYRMPSLAQTDADGRFRIEGLRDGSWALRMLTPDQHERLRLEAFEITADDRHPELALRCPDDPPQRGRIEGLGQPGSTCIVAPWNRGPGMQPGDTTPPAIRGQHVLDATYGVATVQQDGQFELFTTPGHRRPLAILPHAAQLGGSPIAVVVAVDPLDPDTGKELVIDAGLARLGTVRGRVDLGKLRPRPGRLWVVATPRGAREANTPHNGFRASIGPRVPLHRGRYALQLAAGAWTVHLCDMTTGVLLADSPELLIEPGGETVQSLEADCGMVRVQLPEFAGQLLELSCPTITGDSSMFRELRDLPPSFDMILPTGRHTIRRLARSLSSDDQPWAGPELDDPSLRVVEVRRERVAEASFRRR